MTSRSDAWWEDRHLRLRRATKPTRRAASSCSRSTASRRRTRSTGRTSPSRAVCPASRLVVREALGATPQATAAIWRFLLDVDWMSVVEVPLAPPDHPLFLLLALPRRAQYRMGDGLWVRLVDLPARARRAARTARAARSCSRCATRSATGTTDAGGSTAASCERTDAEPDLALDVSVLGSAYLGAVSFTQLRDAGRVRGVAGGSGPPARMRCSRGARCPGASEIF